ncbi:MAG TPA: cupin domain-containing protein [Candidatus Polarisedimenticolaceae bacterium]
MTTPPDPTFDYASLVDYQEKAVVSRTLLKRGGGTITLFAFDAGQELSEHAAPFDALVHVLEGVGELTVFGAPRRLEAGRAVLMPAGAPHAVRAVERFKMALTLLRP